MNVARRSKDLKALLDIRIGAGAAIFPPNVQHVHLEFAKTYNEGQFGARKVWRNYLPRLKYYNPSVSMTVDRHSNSDGPSILTVFLKSAPTPLSMGSADGQATKAALETTQTIDMKHMRDSDILTQLLKVTDAVSHEPTAAETVELEEQAIERRKRDRDRERQNRINERLKYEKELLQQARDSTS